MKLMVINLKCPSCGAQIPNNEEKFCSFCGFELKPKEVKSAVLPKNITVSKPQRRKKGCC